MNTVTVYNRIELPIVHTWTSPGFSIAPLLFLSHPSYPRRTETAALIADSPLPTQNSIISFLF